MKTGEEVTQPSGLALCLPRKTALWAGLQQAFGGRPRQPSTLVDHRQFC